MRLGVSPSNREFIKDMKMKHRIEISINAEGRKLAIMSPINDEGIAADGGYRIAGPKAWGGSKVIASIDINEKDLYEYIKAYTPDLLIKPSV
jgi:hypothetical protein